MQAPQSERVPFWDREELLDFLLEVSQFTGETLDLDRLLPAVADIIARVIPHDLIAILLYNEKSQGLRIRYSRGHRDEIVRNLVIPLGEGLTGIAAATRQVTVVNNVLEDPRYLPTLDAVRSELAVPMVSRGKLVGVIDIQSTRVNAFSEQSVAVLRLIASRVVVAIDNARLYRRLAQQNRTWRLLAVLSQQFSSILQLDELLASIAKAIRALIQYDAFSILLVDEQRKCLRHRFSERYDQRVAPDNLPLGKGITGAAAEKRETIRVDDTASDPRYIALHPDIRSEVAVPLIAHDRVAGVMDLESERIAYFTEEHVRLLSLLAPQIATSIENARLYEEIAAREQRMEQDLQAARRVQSILMPRSAPDLGNLEIGIGWRPAREVSGDIFDFFKQSDDTAIFAFGDSSGKGAAAALYGSLVGGLLRTLAPRFSKPGELMKSLNEILLERRVEASYVTLMLVFWSAQNRKMTVANAGALTPLICRGGQRLKLVAEGIPLGLLDNREYDEVTWTTEPGDVLLFFSDGVEDQVNQEDEEIGHMRLFQTLTQMCHLPAQTIVDEMFAEIDRFRDGMPLADDQTLIAVKVR